MIVNAALPPVVPAASLPATLPVPSADDALKFEAALVPPREVVPEAIQPQVQPAIVTPDTLGERILTSVEKMRVDYQAGMGRVDATMQNQQARMPDMMRLMVDVMQMSLQQEMLSKTVGRTTQNIDTLLKGQ